MDCTPNMSNTKQAILITGGAGFLGSYILNRLYLEGHHIILLKKNSTDISRIKHLLRNIDTYDAEMVGYDQIFLNHNVGIVIHCATNYGRKTVDPMEVLEANLLMPLKLLELAKRHGIKCFINTDTILDKRVNFYSLSKGQFKEWLKVYATELTCINVALGHFFGPGDDETKFISFILSSLRKQAKFIELTKGEQMRDFVFIDDVVDAFIKIIDNQENFVPAYINYQVGSEKLTSIKELVLLMKEMIGNTETKLLFGALPYRNNEVMTHKVNSARLKRLGWRPSISLEEGLSITIAAEQNQRIT